MSAFKHFFHHRHTRVATDGFFGDAGFVLGFGDEVDDFVDLFYEFLLCGVEFFENFAMEGEEKSKNQNIKNEDSKDDICSGF